MVQFALAKQWSPRVRTSVNLYGYDLDHQIRGGTERGTPGNPLTKIQQQNREGRRGYGVELEAEYQVAEDLSVRANYAYYTPQNALPDDVSRLAPEHQIYTALDWRIAQDWSLNARLKWVSDREWESMGEAAKIEDYTWAGATLRRSDPQGWFFSLTLDNLFDADGAEPALFSAIPYGIPLPGRRVMAQFGWHFQ
jgi:outer membrane receptor protein involved in Fe transport